MRETRDYCDIDEIAAQSAQARKGQILVSAGELAVCDNVRIQDRHKLSGLSHCPGSGQ